MHDRTALPQFGASLLSRHTIMQLAGVKRLPDPPILTPASDSKRRKPLAPVPGNTVTTSPVAQLVVAQGTPLTSQLRALDNSAY